MKKKNNTTNYTPSTLASDPEDKALIFLRFWEAKRGKSEDVLGKTSSPDPSSESTFSLLPRFPESDIPIRCLRVVSDADFDFEPPDFFLEATSFGGLDFDFFFLPPFFTAGEIEQKQRE